MSKHLIKSEKTPHGVIGWASKGNDNQYCEAGEVVRLRWQPDAKWGLLEAHYTDEGGNVVAIENGEFVMPASNVVIGGTFKRFVLPDWTGDQENEANNVLDWLTAGDITSKSQTPLIITNKFVAKTTGGDADFKSGDALLLNIKGNLDASLNPFLADSFVSTGMNLVDPSATLTIGGKTAYYFPVVAGNWGAYGTTQENNGFIVIGGSVDEVYYKSTKPTAGSYGAACGKTTYNGVNYYTPSAMGWLTIVCNDATVPACHIAWSNYNDTVGGTFGNTSKSIDADVQWIHTWGMAALTGGGRSVFDEIDIEGGKRYRRVDRVLLPTLTWVKTTIEGEGGNSYIYTATVTGMATNGLWNTLFANLEVDGNTIIYQSSTITTVEDLQTAMSGYQFYFELDTVASANCSTITANTVNDFGLTYFMAGEEIAPVAAFVAESFFQSGKDQLFNAVTYQKILAFVCAAALCQQDSRLSTIENNIKNGFNYLKVTNLDVTRKLTQPA